MDKTVAELNIEHYRKLLLTDIDEVKRETVKKLLSAEEAKLAHLIKRKKMPGPDRT